MTPVNTNTYSKPAADNSKSDIITTKQFLRKNMQRGLNSGERNRIPVAAHIITNQDEVQHTKSITELYKSAFSDDEGSVNSFIKEQCGDSAPKFDLVNRNGLPPVEVENPDSDSWIAECVAPDSKEANDSNLLTPNKLQRYHQTEVDASQEKFHIYTFPCVDGMVTGSAEAKNFVMNTQFAVELPVDDAGRYIMSKMEQTILVDQPGNSMCEKLKSFSQNGDFGDLTSYPTEVPSSSPSLSPSSSPSFKPSSFQSVEGTFNQNANGVTRGDITKAVFKGSGSVVAAVVGVSALAYIINYVYSAKVAPAPVGNAPPVAQGQGGNNGGQQNPMIQLANLQGGGN